MKPQVLIHGAHLESLHTEWQSSYEIHLLRDFADPAEFLAGPGQHVEVIVSDGGPIPGLLLQEMPRLRLVACFSTGYPGIDAAVLQARGIRLTTAAGVNAHDVADHAIAMMLAAWHGILRADSTVRGGGWRTESPPRRSLRGRRAGIVGLGRIGLEIAARLAPVGLHIAWYGPNEKPGAPYPRTPDLITLARESDVLIVACRATQANRHLVDAAAIDEIGAEGILVNVSRGMLIDEDALIARLKDGRLGGAALDVFENEPTPADRWRDVPNVVLTPHIAGFTQEAGPAMMRLLTENVRRYFSGEPLLTPAW